MKNTSYLELSESALRDNLEFIRQNFCNQAKLSCVVKGNAYGHGISEFTPLLVKHGVQHISVFSSYEAFQVKDAIGSGAADIMIMGDIPDENIDDVLESELEFFVFDLRRLGLAVDRARALGKKAKIHVEVETGMNRLGLNSEDLKEAARSIKENLEVIELEGICTHFAGAESASNHHRVDSQIKRFVKARNFLKEEGLTPKRSHCACSAAAIRFPETRMDMVRIGIMTYGLWPSEESLADFNNIHKTRGNPLRRVISWKSRLMGLKKVKKGEYIGYGASYLATEDKQLAIIPVGYGNGFTRTLSNEGRVIIRGKETKVVGTVNMNAIVVDVTSMEKVEIGDTAILIGKERESEISVSPFTDSGNQMNYELLARLPKDLNRYVVD